MPQSWYFAVKTLPRKEWENAGKPKSLKKVGIGLDGISTLVNFSTPRKFMFGCCKLSRQQTLERELAEWANFCCLIFCFPAWTVSNINCSVDNGCLHQQFKMSYERNKVNSRKIQQLAVTFLPLCDWFLDCWLFVPQSLWQVGNLKHNLDVVDLVLQRNGFFKESCFYLTWKLLWIAFTVLFELHREGSTLFHFCLDDWFRNCWCQSLVTTDSFRKSFGSICCLIYVQ